MLLLTILPFNQPVMLGHFTPSPAPNHQLASFEGSLVGPTGLVNAMFPVSSLYNTIQPSRLESQTRRVFRSCVDCPHIMIDTHGICKIMNPPKTPNGAPG